MSLIGGTVWRLERRGGSSGGAGGSGGRRVGSGKGREWAERVGGSASVGDDGSDGADSMEAIDGGPEAICGKKGEVGSVWVMGGWEAVEVWWG